MLDSRHKITNRRQIVMFTIFIWTSACVTNICFSLFAPFLPLEMVQKGYHPSSMGPITSVYSLGFIISALSLSFVINKIKRRLFLALNLLLCGITMVCFSFLMSGDLTNTQFVLIAMVLRILQGFVSGFFQTLCFSIMCRVLEDQEQKVVFMHF